MYLTEGTESLAHTENIETIRNNKLKTDLAMRKPSKSEENGAICFEMRFVEGRSIDSNFEDDKSVSKRTTSSRRLLGTVPESDYDVSGKEDATRPETLYEDTHLEKPEESLETSKLSERNRPCLFGICNRSGATGGFRRARGKRSRSAVNPNAEAHVYVNNDKEYSHNTAMHHDIISNQGSLGTIFTPDTQRCRRFVRFMAFVLLVIFIMSATSLILVILIINGNMAGPEKRSTEFVKGM